MAGSVMILPRLAHHFRILGLIFRKRYAMFSARATSAVFQMDIQTSHIYTCNVEMYLEEWKGRWNDILTNSW